MPEGILADVWNSSNLTRDEHMIQVILVIPSSGG